jgi:hypothetical protein
MYTLEKCRCLTCYKQNTQHSSPKWALLGGRQGDLLFSEEATRWQFDTLPEDPRSPRPVQMDIMPKGSGVCLRCYENISSDFRKILEAIKITDMRTEQTNPQKVSPTSAASRVPWSPSDPGEIVKQMSKKKNTSWLWPRTPSGWKLVVRQRAFSNDICSDMQDGLDLGGKRISWFSPTTGRFENGLIESYDIKTRLCKVTREKGSQVFTRNLSPSSLFPPNAMDQCTGRCYCPTCAKPKCCIFCQSLCLSGTEGPGYNWYCSRHPVEKFFVLGSANQYEVEAWMVEDNHRRGEAFSVIDTDSPFGIALYGSQREVVLAECEGASISTTVNVKAKPAKKDMCHGCKKESYHGRICPSTGDSNWYCDVCWKQYWNEKKQQEKKQQEDFPSLS